MEMFETLSKVNLWAVILAAFSYLILGTLWYSPLLFGNKWIKLKGFTDADFKTNKPMWMITLASFLSAAVAATVISIILGPKSNGVFGAIIGACIAIFFISMSKLTSVLFENQPVRLFFLHAGFDIVAFIIMGSIIGYWR